MFKKNKAKEPKIKKVRFQTFRDAYKVTKSVKPWIGAAIAGDFIATWALGIALGFVIGHPIYLGFVALPVAVLAAMFFFTRIASSAAYVSIEGQVGAGASVLMAMGMMMLPPVMISLPFKLLLFVLVDGWELVIGSLVKSFG